MPAKGTRKLTDQQKVEIVIGKQTKHKKTDTYRKLASDLDVSEMTVRKTTLESLTERQRHLYEETVKKLKFSSLSLTANSLEKANELVGRASETRDLAGVVAAGKFGHEVYRLETGQATAIPGEQTSPGDQCRTFIKLVMSQVIDGKKASELQALETLKVFTLPGVEEAYKLRWIEGELAKNKLIESGKKAPR